jgi:hypothetical protein
MNIRNFDPAKGQAFQGDIAIIPMPAGVKIATIDEIKPIDGRLIIQEGEASGHHHAIDLPRTRNFRPAVEVGDPVLHVRDTRLRRALGGRSNAAGTARLYRDQAAVEALRGAGVITRVDLAIGCLVVEGGPVTIEHEEHDGIRVPPGNYYLGRQVESAGAEERVVLD